MTRPNVLSDEQVVEWLTTNRGEETLKSYRCGANLINSLIVEHYGREAQRDVTSDYYEQEGYVKLAENQNSPGWEFYSWPTTYQSREAMKRYQTGRISKNEHESISRQLYGEELAIYKKAQSDMLEAGFRKVELPQGRKENNDEQETDNPNLLRET